MILERKSIVNIHDVKERYGELLGDSPAGGIMDTLEDIVKLQQVYTAAMNEISTKLEILDDEFQVSHKHNPIHHIECRLKDLRSLMEKMNRKGLNPDMATARREIMDIAGVRVVCNYVDDIYTIEKLLLNQSDITLVKRKDYIKNPKPNGYRSLHVVVKIAVYLSDRTEEIPVEIQIRTTAMDLWAGLEHSLQYKNDVEKTREHQKELFRCARELANIEHTLQKIHLDIL